MRRAEGRQGRHNTGKSPPEMGTGSEQEQFCLEARQHSDVLLQAGSAME